MGPPQGLSRLPGWSGRDTIATVVLGPIIVVAVIVLVLPPLFLIAGMMFSAVLGWTLVDYTDGTHEGSELIDLNR